MVLVDSCSISLENKHNRLRGYEGLSRTGINKHGRYLGLKLHPAIVYDKENKMILGISSTQFVHVDRSTCEEQGDKWKRKKQFVEEKESYKWINACHQSTETLSNAAHVTFVMDREADIIELLDRIPNQRTSLIVRVQHNRYIIDLQGNQVKSMIFLKKVNLGAQ